jgi:uncharacterized protein (UPF0333 family)
LKKYPLIGIYFSKPVMLYLNKLKNTKMKKLALSLLFAAGLLFAGTVDANAQAKKTVAVAGKAVAKSRGANPNIKMDAPTVDKPVAKNRSATCAITFDNWTGLYIKIYVDGNYKGTVDAWGKGTVSVGDGYTTVYCVSVGGTREWTAAGDCREAYTYKLQ